MHTDILMVKPWQKLILIAAVGFAMTSLIARPAKAAEAPGQALEISPPVINMQGDPGSTVTTQIKIRNVSSGPIQVTGQADDFGAKGENGDPQILFDETEATHFSLKFWVAKLPTFTLAPKEAKTTTVTITLPKNAEPGGHYGVIRFTGKPVGADDSVALSASIGSLVLLKVNGDIHEHLSWAEFFTASGTKHTGFFEKGPVTIVERIKNDGNIHLQPTGTVKVYNLLGRLSAVLPINATKRNVLPDSVRRFDQTFNPKWPIGIYRARANVTYGNNGSLGSKTITFWIIPWRWILLIIVLLALLITGIILLMHRYRRRVIEKYKNTAEPAAPPVDPGNNKE